MELIREGLHNEKKQAGRTAKEKLFRAALFVCAGLSVLAVLTIILYLLVRAFPAFAEAGVFKFIFGSTWDPAANRYGILPMIAGSIFVTAAALIIAVPVGVLSAVFLVRFCPKRLRKVFGNVINLLAGIPSIIYGLFGMQVIVPALKEAAYAFGIKGATGDGIMASGIILAIMILPTIVAVSKNALLAVPKSYYEGALALGASKERAVFTVQLPAAKRGVLASVIMGVGRALGETMAVMMVAGGSAKFPLSPFHSMRTLTVNIAMEMSYATGLLVNALIATAVVLFIFILIINILFKYISEERKTKGKKSKAGGGARPATSLAQGEIVISEKKRAKAAPKSHAPYVSVISGMHIKKRRFSFSRFFKYLSYASVSLALISLLSIILFVLVKGLPAVSWHFLFGKNTVAAPSVSGAIVSTLSIIFVALLIAIPVGVAAALYLTEYSKRGSKLVKLIRTANDCLSGVPSIIFGLFGMFFIVQFMGLGTSIWAGGITISLMILPTVIRSVEESLLSVPDMYREGSMALGAGKMKTTLSVVLPQSLLGIVTAVILSVGRIVSESAVLIFTAGGARDMIKGFSSPGASLAVAMYSFVSEGKRFDEAYATAVVLIVLVVAVNLLTGLAERKKKGEA